MAADYYGALGVLSTASEADIKKAYRRLARELHPDVNPDPAAQDRFKAISTAYEVLSDPEKRRIVDLGGDPLSNSGTAGGSPFQGFGMSDIMDAFFGGGGRSQRGPRSRSRPGSDALLHVDLDLAEAAFGTDRVIPVDTAVLCETCHGDGRAAGTQLAQCPQCEGRGEVQTVTRTLLGQMMTTAACPRCQGTGSIIPSPCPACAGDGRVRKRRDITVRVPAGVASGMRIHLPGHGEVGPGGGPPGDLYVEVHEKPHPVFQRERDDIHCEITLPMTAAALGTTMSLTTLDGDEPIEVRPGVQSGQIVTLKGRGITHLKAHGRGDLHAHIAVETPTKLDEEQEALLRQLAKLRNEEMPNGQPAAAGLLGKLRGAFTGR